MKKYTGQAFIGVEKVLRETFLPRLLFGKQKTLPPIVGDLSTFPVKKYGLFLQNPVTPAAEKYTGSLHVSYKLIGAVMDERDFSTADHLWAVKQERWDRKKYQDDENDVKLGVIANDKGDFEKPLFLCNKHTGFWMSVRGTTVTGTVLPAAIFHDCFVHVITTTPLTFR